MNVIRGVGAILGWIVLSVTPNSDRLSRNLQLKDDLLNLQQPADQPQLQLQTSLPQHNGSQNGHVQFDPVKSSGIV